jgi:HlyD family secretion protein
MVQGEVSRISLKAKKEDNATVFPIEITITETNGAVLRAGYSANADIIIEEMENAITIPERVITMKDGRAFIEVPGDDPSKRWKKRWNSASVMPSPWLLPTALKKEKKWKNRFVS